VRRRQQLHARPNQRARPHSYLGRIEKDAVDVDERVRADVDVLTVIAEERRLDPDAVAESTEQLAKNALTLVSVGRRSAENAERRARARRAVARSAGSREL
jgi:hypothetical protein